MKGIVGTIRFLAVLLLLQPLRTLASAEVVTNETVVRMVQAHLSLQVIEEYIRTNPGNYSLTSSDLIKLKQQGVPDEVIAAMQAKSHDRTTTENAGSRAQTASNQAPSCQAPNVWQPTGDGNQASMCSRTAEEQEQGVFQITASCDSKSLRFHIVFLSDTNPPIGFLHYAPLQNSSSNFRVPVRVGLNHDPFSTEVESQEDFDNSVHVLFPQHADLRLLHYDFPYDRDGAATARLITFELKTQNGVNHVVEIKPQDPAFEAFTAECRRRLWTSPAPADGFKFLTSVPILKRRYPSPISLEQFVAELPDRIKNAALSSGAANRDYERETETIISSVRTCGQLGERAKQMYVKGGYVVGLPKDYSEAVRKLGPEYAICGTGPRYISPQVAGVTGNGRGIVLDIRTANPNWRFWEVWKIQFFVDVSFEQHPRDRSRFDQYALPSPEDYLIDSALVQLRQ